MDLIDELEEEARKLFNRGEIVAYDYLLRYIGILRKGLLRGETMKIKSDIIDLCEHIKNNHIKLVDRYLIDSKYLTNLERTQAETAIVAAGLVWLYKECYKTYPVKDEDLDRPSEEALKITEGRDLLTRLLGNKPQKNDL